MTNSNRTVGITTSRTAIGWRKFASSFGGDSLAGFDTVGTVVLALDDKVAYDIESNFSTPFKDILDKATSEGLVGGGLKLWEALTASPNTVNPWFKYLKAWDNTPPISIPLQFSFKMGQYDLWDAKDEVVNPIVNLIMPVLPRLIKGTLMAGPSNTAARLLGLILGETGLSSQGIYDAATGLQIFDEDANQTTYNITIGPAKTPILSIPDAYITNASVSFSTEMDQNGYPIAGSVTLKAEGMMPPAIKGGTTRFFSPGKMLSGES